MIDNLTFQNSMPHTVLSGLFWIAIWLLPQNNQYGTWPASGEIDILEARGNAELYDVEKTHIGVEQVAQTLHFGPYYPLNGWEKTNFPTNSDKGKGYDTDFHLYQLEWTPGTLFTLDICPHKSITLELNLKLAKNCHVM
jgi:beta-glucanase (GH16 family)